MPPAPELHSSKSQKQDDKVDKTVEDIKAMMVLPESGEAPNSSAEELANEEIKDEIVDLERQASTPATPSTVEAIQDENLVTWDGPNDMNNPMNWSIGYKWVITLMFGTMTFCVTFASSEFSSVVEVTAELYNVSTEATTLGVSLFVLVSTYLVSINEVHI
jgi:DHA1 family multidrug resistance protein-like MFS transporter